MSSDQSVMLDERTVPHSSRWKHALKWLPALMASCPTAVLLPICMIVLMGSPNCAFAQPPTEPQQQPVVPPAEQQTKSLVQIEIKNESGSDFMMRATELERGDRTSKMKVVCKKRIGSVGSSMFVVRAFYDIAKARKCEYFVNLKEWTDKGGDQFYIAGFTSKKDADLKKEFGEQFDYNNESGQKRALLCVSQFALVFESHPAKDGTAPARPIDGKNPAPDSPPGK